MHPLHAALCVLDASCAANPPPAESFGAGFSYPSKSFSSLPGLNYDLQVEWDKEQKVLSTTVAIEGTVMRAFDGMEGLLDSLNHEISPYVEEIEGGTLGVTPVVSEPELIAPCFRFHLGGCDRISAESVQTHFQKYLFDKGALALWLTRSVFAYAIATGHEPSVPERMRLLQLEHGKFQLSLHECEESMLPRGFYTTLFHENSMARH